MAAVNACTGNAERAATLYQDSLDRARDVGATVLVGSVLLGLAAVAAASGLPEDGAQLLGAAGGIAERMHAPLFPRDQPVRNRCLAALTTALGPEKLVVACEAGRALSVEAAMEMAQTVAEAVASP